jgi:hypothetical protein
MKKTLLTIIILTVFTANYALYTQTSLPFKHNSYSELLCNADKYTDVNTNEG